MLGFVMEGHIFVWAAEDQTAKFKDCQYFRLYGICWNNVNLQERCVKTNK